MNDLVAITNQRVLIGGSLSDVVKYGDTVVKSYSGQHARGYDKLRREVKYINSLPASLKPFYPRIIEVNDTLDKYSYSMPHYNDMMSLTEYVFSSSDITHTWDRIAAVLDFMESKHYPADASLNDLDSYIQTAIHTRLEQSHSALRDIAELTSILDGSITIGDINLLSLDDIRTALAHDDFTNSTLRPTELCLFHGNFHLGNILIGDESFLLIDPRGERFGSKLYDICKLFVHILIRYDEIHYDKFNIEENSTTIETLLSDMQTGERYGYIQRRLLEKYSAEYGSDFFMRSLMVIGGVHAISFASYHARKNNPCLGRVQAYLGAGMVLLSAYLNDQPLDLGVSLYPYEATGKGL